MLLGTELEDEKIARRFRSANNIAESAAWKRMLVLTLMERVTELPLGIAIGPMLGKALVGLVRQWYTRHTLLVMSLTVNCAALFPMMIGLAT